MGPWICLWSRGVKPTETPELQVSTVIEPMLHTMNPCDGIHYKSSIIISQYEQVANMALGITCSLCRSEWKSWCVAGRELLKNISDLLDCWIRNPFTNNWKKQPNSSYNYCFTKHWWMIYLFTINSTIKGNNPFCLTRKWYSISSVCVFQSGWERRRTLS